MKRLVFVLFIFCLGALTTAVADRYDAERARLERNKKTVIGFYTRFMNQHDPVGAQDAYVGAHYTQHNPFVKDGREGFIEAFTEVFKRSPKAHMEIKRVVAEGDYVVVHVHHLASDPKNKGRASMDWFRLDEKGKIVEHWDVMQWVPDDDEVENTNTMF